MHVIMGATGHIGSELTRLLLTRAEPVTVVVHTEERGRPWLEQAARCVVLDVHDTQRLALVAARELLSSSNLSEPQHVEGPERYSALQVAELLGKMLERRVKRSKCRATNALGCCKSKAFPRPPRARSAA